MTEPAPEAAAQRPSVKNRPRFFIAMGFVALTVALVGFAKTFFVPVVTGVFQAPIVIYFHGACAFAWIITFAAQPLLIRARKFREHRIVGFISLAAAAGFALTAVPAGAFAAARDHAAGGGEAAISSIVGTFTTAVIFSALVFAGVLTRKKAETHKRFMLLATLVVLWPAWFRFRHYFPDVPRPDIVFAVVLADSLILIGAVRDWIVLRRVHPVWLICGTGVVIENVAEVILFDSSMWRAFAHVLYGLFGR